MEAAALVPIDESVSYGLVHRPEPHRVRRQRLHPS